MTVQTLTKYARAVETAAGSVMRPDGEWLIDLVNGEFTHDDK